MDLELVLMTEMYTHTHTHTHTRLASHPSDHTRFKTHIDSTELAAIKECEQIIIHVPCQRKHTTGADGPHPSLIYLTTPAQTIAPENPRSSCNLVSRENNFPHLTTNCLAKHTHTHTHTHIHTCAYTQLVSHIPEHTGECKQNMEGRVPTEG